MKLHIILIFAFLAATVFAVDKPNPPELIAARARYNAAFTTAIKPVRDKYAIELQYLKGRAMAANNLELAVAIDQGIKAEFAAPAKPEVSIPKLSNPPELIAARARYNAAFTTAIKPVRDKYAVELQYLKGRAMAANNLELAVAIDQEIKAEFAAPAKPEVSIPKLSNATLPPFSGGAGPAKELDLAVIRGKESKGLKKDKWIFGWGAGESMTWSSAKLAPGKYGVFVTGGGWRPLSKKMRVTAGTEMIERSIWTNTQSDMKEAGFDLGVMEVTEAQIGVTLACIETHPPQKGNKEREGFISGIKFTPLKTP